jgi:hypothetical protein
MGPAPSMTGGGYQERPWSPRSRGPVGRGGPSPASAGPRGRGDRGRAWRLTDFVETPLAPTRRAVLCHPEGGSRIGLVVRLHAGVSLSGNAVVSDTDRYAGGLSDRQDRRSGTTGQHIEHAENRHADGNTGLLAGATAGRTRQTDLAEPAPTLPPVAGICGAIMLIAPGNAELLWIDAVPF